eukprot:m51a1_g9185 hypothetical protein (338) ;mRNA; r:64062-65075
MDDVSVNRKRSHPDADDEGSDSPARVVKRRVDPPAPPAAAVPADDPASSSAPVPPDDAFELFLGVVSTSVLEGGGGDSEGDEDEDLGSESDDERDRELDEGAGKKAERAMRVVRLREDPRERYVREAAALSKAIYGGSDEGWGELEASARSCGIVIDLDAEVGEDTEREEEKADEKDEEGKKAEDDEMGKKDKEGEKESKEGSDDESEEEEDEEDEDEEGDKSEDDAGETVVSMLVLRMPLSPGGTAEMTQLVVKAEYRDSGIGSRMVKACMDYARKAGVHEMDCFAVGSRAFYERHGFRELKDAPESKLTTKNKERCFMRADITRPVPHTRKACRK